jgi:RluA family pseudouridine synthase
MNKIDITIEKPQDGMRLDLALVAVDVGLSRRKIRTIIDVGGCYLNRKRIRVASRTVRQGDRIQLEYSESGLKSTKQQSYTLSDRDILFEDDHLIAINKPPGLPSQAMRTQSIMHVETCLRRYFKENSRPETQFILVHRLDKETSGVLLVAKNKKWAERLMDHFRNRTIQKFYLAVTCGVPPNNKFKVECKLSPINSRTGLVSVDPNGKTSLTDFKVVGVAHEANLALVACYPHTGRSHQLRVHLADHKCQILGDKRYSGGDLKRPVPSQFLEQAASHHFLHAAAIKIPNYKGGNPLVIDAPLPPLMAKVCEELLWSGDILQPKFSD